MKTSHFATRLTLLQKVKESDDAQVWEEFVTLYTPFIRGIVHKTTFNPMDCDDLIQNVLIRLWKKLSLYDESQGRFRSWLTLVTRNSVLNSLNHLKRHKIDVLSLDSDEYHPHEVTVSPQITEIIENEWKTHICRLAMESVNKLFSGEAVTAFNMSRKGLSNSEISRQLGIKEESVKVLKSRVKTRLIKEVQKLIEHLEN